MADGLPKADVIIVPGHKLDGPGCASVTMIARVEAGIDLFQKELAPSLLLCGGVNKYSPAEAELMTSIAREHGVPESCLFQETESRTTWENALNSQTLITSHGWRTAYIVSDAQHLKRCGLVFSLTGLDKIYLLPTNLGENSTRIWARELLASIYYKGKMYCQKHRFNRCKADIETFLLPDQ